MVAAKNNSSERVKQKEEIKYVNAHKDQTDCVRPGEKYIHDCWKPLAAL